MNKIRKNDTVRVIGGRDRGKTGKVLVVFPKDKRALVEGINFIKRHTRKTQQDSQGGIVTKESPINVSKLLLLCKACNKPARVGFTKLGDGTRARVCKKCNEVI